MPPEHQRASIEATVGRLVAVARNLGFSDDDVTHLVVRSLGNR
jgi:hypothetical protein